MRMVKSSYFFSQNEDKIAAFQYINFNHCSICYTGHNQGHYGMEEVSLPGPDVTGQHPHSDQCVGPSMVSLTYF